MNNRTRLPQNDSSLISAFSNCKERGKFKEVERLAYIDYLARAQKDLASAERDLNSEDLHWARVKAYQALFHLLNALLVKHLGYFSKDHVCVIVALMSNNIITSEVAGKLNLLMGKTIKNVTSKKVYEDIDEFRIQRNFALYKPKAWIDVRKEDVAQEINKIKLNFKLLVELL